MDSSTDQKRFFFELTPERILSAVELSGVRCTGRVLQLNSMENRVYEVEIEVDDPDSLPTPSARFRVVKFYRPGRWSREQILEEHQFLIDAYDAELPVIPPVRFVNGETVAEVPEAGIFFALFPKCGGRLNDELNEQQLLQLGRLIARLHIVGASRESKARLTLDPRVYGTANLNYLEEVGVLPQNLRAQYLSLGREIVKEITPLFDSVPFQRIHGDCHWGNVIWRDSMPYLVDFDDTVRGPCAQDIWLLAPAYDVEGLRARQLILEGYAEMRPCSMNWLKLVEPLRFLRYIQFSAWVAKRWDDPAFPKVFPHFGTEQYWMGQLEDIRQQRERIEHGLIPQVNGYE